MATTEQTLSTAVQNHQAGNIGQAEQYYRIILREEPTHPLALHSLGLIAHQRGKHNEAAELIDKAITSNPQIPQFYNSLGVVQEALGRIEKAVSAYRQAVMLKPDYAEAYNNMAIAVQSQGDYESAVEICKRAVRLCPGYAPAYNTMGYCLQAQSKFAEAVAAYNEATKTAPDYAEAHNHLGVVLSEQGQQAKAIDSYRRALQVAPDYAEVYNNLGIALRAQGRTDKAAENYEQAIQLEPKFPEAYYNLANVQKEQSLHIKAIENCRMAIQLKPDYAEAYNLLGIIQNELGKTDQAIENHRKAIQLDPARAEFYNNLAIVLRTRGDFEQAITNYVKAIDLEPRFPEAHCNLANALKEQGRCEEAIDSYTEAIRLKPDYADAHWNRSIAFLLNGDFAQGFKGYKWRHKANLDTMLYPHSYDAPRWDGTEFAGKRLLVHCEQGLGDTLQFVRYLPIVKALGGTVILEAWRPLLGLLQGIPGVDELVELSWDKKSDVDFDCFASLLDLPMIFGTTVDTIPAEVPYLRAEGEKVNRWRARLARPEFKVGIAWAGSPTHGNDRNRSCSLEQFIPISQVQGVRLYSLQKGDATQQITQLTGAMQVEDIGVEFDDFADTAAAIENMDLVISVDTAVAHLAGALARPVWTLLPFAPDWRWMLGREGSPWYPTMRLFRQPEPGGWDAVFERTAEQLQTLVNKQGTESPEQRD